MARRAGGSGSRAIAPEMDSGNGLRNAGNGTSDAGDRPRRCGRGLRNVADGTWSQAAELVPDLFAVDAGVDVTLLADQAVVGGENSVHVFDLSCILRRPDLDANCTLTVFDYLTFLNHFQDGDAQAGFDGVSEFTAFDFLAFQTAFDAGCG